tara:strand:+ start:70 stop:342 length:273 start_codon:yes stop_codon:yes gene_type:complete
MFEQLETSTQQKMNHHHELIVKLEKKYRDSPIDEQLGNTLKRKAHHKTENNEKIIDTYEMSIIVNRSPNKYGRKRITLLPIIIHNKIIKL